MILSFSVRCGLLAAINRVELHALRICIFYVYIQQIYIGGHLLIPLETSATLVRKKPRETWKKIDINFVALLDKVKDLWYNYT